jgi:predicted amidophosphoribosyltransferase
VGVVWCQRCLAAAVDIHCRTAPSGLVVHAGARYQGQVTHAVVAHKEHGQLSLVRPLARLLVAAMGLPKGATIVSVPSRGPAVRARGQDHAQRLARRAAAVCQGSAATPLRWARAADDQAGLGVVERRLNVERAMVARGRPPSGGVWLIDDVMTSGATLDEAARALAAAGWRLSGAAVVAAVDARSDQPAARGRSALADHAGLR